MVVSVREADFLCQNDPLVSERKFPVSLTDRRKRVFLLGVGMDRKKYLKDYHKRFPWAKTLRWISNRCDVKKHLYYKYGIKNFLTTEDLKYLWFRDKAYLLKKPSIDRIDIYGNYTLDNCRYIEYYDNIRRGRRHKERLELYCFNCNAKCKSRLSYVKNTKWHISFCGYRCFIAWRRKNPNYYKKGGNMLYELEAYNTDCRYPQDVRYRTYTKSKKKADKFNEIPKIQFTDSGHGIVFLARAHKGRRKPEISILGNYVQTNLTPKKGK